MMATAVAISRRGQIRGRTLQGGDDAKRHGDIDRDHERPCEAERDQFAPSADPVPHETRRRAQHRSMVEDVGDLPHHAVGGMATTTTVGHQNQPIGRRASTVALRSF